MGNYSKGIAAFVGAVVRLLANFGVTVPENILGLINASLPLVTAALVYAVPNRSAT